MSSCVAFHTQVASIMEVLANAAVAEICKLMDDGYAILRMEMSQSQKENEQLRRKLENLELQVARGCGARRPTPRGEPGSRAVSMYSWSVQVTLHDCTCKGNRAE